jgi:hypothetical protein
VEIVCDGADAAVLARTPDFVKSIPVWKAMEESALLAYEMNGEPLPHWNGYPLRLVVPGWTATYWMKHITSIEAATQPFKGFWMAPAYRIPKGRFPVVDRFLTQETDTTTPITEMVVNSLITSLSPGQRFAAGQTIEVRGVAWDGGFGIALVEVSQDGGRSWRPAQLADLGHFSWRWSYMSSVRSARRVRGERSRSRIGASQTFGSLPPRGLPPKRGAADRIRRWGCRE